MVYQQQQQQHQANQQQASSQQSQRQSGVLASHQTTGQHHNSNQLGQYMGQQQQMQSNAHHGSAGYYQTTAHLYQSAYTQAGHTQQQEQAQSHHHQQQQHQQSQQHSTPEYHHHPGSNLAVTGPAPNPSVAGVHSSVHNAPSSALNQANWSPGVGSLTGQAHHPVVTDHSTMAYIAHPYQSHNTTVSDHHRNSNGPMASQGLTSHQATSYSVDPLYNSPSAEAAAAAVAAAAYNYNNYNTAFFQTSNNGPHSQTGHPSQAHVSNFWNHNPPSQQQQRSAHSQSANNQNTVQQRQPIVSEQTATNYLHDPRLYYGRPTYGQGLPNIAQTQHQTQPSQLDIVNQNQMMHHRMSNLPQLHTMFIHNELHQVTHQPGAAPTTSVQHQSPIGNQTHQPTSSSTINQTNTNSVINPNQSTSIQQNQSTIANDNTVESANSSIRPINQINKPGTQPPIQKNQQNPGEKDKSLQSSAQSRTTTDPDYGKKNDPIVSSVVSQPIQDSSSHQLSVDIENVFQSSKEALKRLRDPVSMKDPSAPQTSNKNYSSQNVIKSEPYQHPYQKTKPQSQDNSGTTPSCRPIFRTQQDERSKPLLQQQQNDNSIKRPTNNDLDYRLNQDSLKTRSPPPQTLPAAPEQSSPDQLSSLEDSLASLAVSSPRKTTWASIASQPAKVTQPKSLKSKIAGSTSVLSNAKHLAVVSLDSSSLDSKNGINPAIKSSVSAATTSLQRSSMPPPITKLPTVAASLKLDILGDSLGQNNKISWPAVNASANLHNELLKEKEAASKQQSSMNHMNDKKMNHNDDSHIRDRNDSDDSHNYKDYNHNQGGYNSNKIGNAYDSHHRDSWNNRRPIGEHNRFRRDSDRGDFDRDDTLPNEYKEDLREVLNSRRVDNGGFRPNNIHSNGPRQNMNNHFRDRDDLGFRNDRSDRGGPPNHMKRGGPPPMIMDRAKPLQSRNNDNYIPPSRFSQYNNRFDSRDGGPNRHPDRMNSRQPYQPPLREQDGRDPGRDRDRDSRNSREADSPISGSDRPETLTGNNKEPISHQKQPQSLNPSNYNPKVFDLEPVNARYFIIKSYSGDDIHRSIKYAIWCSTNHGNKKLDEAFRQQQANNGSIYLFFSVNGSGHFCGMAQMTSAVDFDSSTGVWAQSKWQGEFSVKWIHVKDVPNNALRHITLENNEDKPVTNSRDTQEVPPEKGKAVLKIIHNYVHNCSIFDQFQHYERRQEEDRLKRSSHGGPPLLNDHHGQSNEHHHGGGRLRDDDRSERMSGPGGMGGGTRFGGRPYINPRPHNEHFQGNHRGMGARMGGPPQPHSQRGHLPHREGNNHHSSDKPSYRENGPVRNSIKLTQ